MSGTSSLTPHQNLLCRLLNADGAGVVRERLGQQVVKDLLAWFQSPTGGNRGLALLHAAPLFDTRIERLTVAHLPDGKHDARFATHANFGAGLLVGAQWMTTKEEGAPFTPETGIDEVLHELALQRFEPDLGPGIDVVPPPSVLTAHLLLLDPELDVVLHAAFRLVASAGLRSNGGQSLRFLFFLGLIAAGVQIERRDAAAPGDSGSGAHRGRGDGLQRVVSG